MTRPVGKVGSPAPAQPVGQAPQGAASETQEETLKTSTGTTKKGQDFFTKVKDFFKPVITALGIIFGISAVDNAPYVKLCNDLKAESSVSSRAQELFKKSQELIEHVKKNGLKNIPENIGVQMSGDLQRLCGNSDEQRYYHNVAVNSWAEAEGGNPKCSKKIQKIISIDDHDNTWVNKNWDPSDTGLVQSLEQLYWGRKIFEMGRKSLNVEEWINTARAPFPTVIQIVPEGLEKHLTHGLLHGPLQERFGLSLNHQLEALDNCTLIALNSSVIQKPNKPLELSAKLIRQSELFKFFRGPDGPRINGKKFYESICDLVNKNGVAVLEPKCIPRYILEADEISGEIHLRVYEKITALKEEIIDNRGSKSEKDAWIEFGRAVKEDAKKGVPHWERIERIKKEQTISEADVKELFEEELKTKPLNELLSELTSDLKSKIKKAQIEKKNSILNDSKIMLKARKKAYQHIRLLGSEDINGYINNCISKCIGKYIGKDIDKNVIQNISKYIDQYAGEDIVRDLSKYISKYTHKDISEEISKEIIEEIIKIKSKKGDFVIYKDMLDENSPYYNPQGFFDKAVEGVPAAFVVHTYDCHGTPVESVMHDITGILTDFADHPKTRYEVARLNSTSLNSEGRHQDIERFVEKSAAKFFSDKGIKEYLEWRTLKYLECRYTKKELEKIFNHEGKTLEFTKEFKDKYTDALSFVSTIQKELSGTSVNTEQLLKVISSFLPEGEKSKSRSVINISEVLDENLRLAEELIKRDSKQNSKESPKDKYTFLYPNEMFLINSSPQYRDSYLYNSVSNLVQKTTTIDPLGQYYWEIQPNREKYQGVPDFHEVIDQGLQIHVAGDSKSDIGMMVRALERGGSASVVFNLIQEKDIYDEVIKQRLGYVKEFSQDKKDPKDHYETCKTTFEICALEECIVDGKVIGYKKIKSFKDGKLEYESDTPISRDEIIKEIKERYQGKIIRNVSPEAYVRRRAEIFGLLSGENIELTPEELNKEWAILAKTKGHTIPTEVTRLNVYHEWRSTDVDGEYIVYRSKKTGGQLVCKKVGESEAKPYRGTEDSLNQLNKFDIVRDNSGKFVYVDSNGSIVKYLDNEDLGRLGDYVLENRLLLLPSGIKSSFLSKNFISNLPKIFHNLLKYSGALMGAGGIVRLLSKLTGSLEDITYKTGYWLSNGLRAVSALGGALRGELNVHKFHNIAFGEAINVISSFLPNGVKHLGLGFGNFILFLGRGQQRAQLQQRTNNHTRKELASAKKLEKSTAIKDRNKSENEPENYFDPRTYVRKVTKIATGLILKVQNEVIQQGIRPLIGELAGNLVSAVVTPVQMIKDIFTSKWRLIFQSEYRQSEKSGTEYKGVPSAGHLLTLVGTLSGIGALIAGTFGRISKFGEVTESGFNLIGRAFISFANAVPFLGIMANAEEVMANTSGLPKLFRDLNGKDDTYDPKKAGLRQYLAGIGFGIVPWFNLENKYVASIFDMVNGLYFLGAAEEEKPNTNMLGRSILRKRQEFYENKQEENIINFSDAA